MARPKKHNKHEVGVLLKEFVKLKDARRDYLEIALCMKYITITGGAGTEKEESRRTNSWKKYAALGAGGVLGGLAAYKTLGRNQDAPGSKIKQYSRQGHEATPLPQIPAVEPKEKPISEERKDDQDLESLQKKNEELKVQAEKSAQGAQKQTLEVEKLKTKIQELETGKAANDENNAQDAKQYGEKKINKLTIEKVDQEKQIQTLQQTIKEIKNKLNTEVDKNNDNEQTQKEQKSKINELETKAKEKLKHLQIENEELQLKAEKSAKEALRAEKNLKQSNADAETGLKNVQEQADKKVNETAQQLQAAEKRANKQAEDVNIFKEKADQTTKEQKQHFTAKITVLDGELIKVNQKSAEYIQELSSLQKENDQLRSKDEQSVNDLRKQSQAVERLQKTNKELQEEKSSNGELIKSLTKKYKTTETNAQDAKQSASTINKELKTELEKSQAKFL